MGWGGKSTYPWIHHHRRLRQGLRHATTGTPRTHYHHAAGDDRYFTQPYFINNRGDERELWSTWSLLDNGQRSWGDKRKMGKDSGGHRRTPAVRGSEAWHDIHSHHARRDWFGSTEPEPTTTTNGTNARTQKRVGLPRRRCRLIR